MSGHHDLGYKLLFAHPELVRELIAGFTPFAWLGAIDTGSFERVNPSYVSPSRQCAVLCNRRERFSQQCV